MKVKYIELGEKIGNKHSKQEDLTSAVGDLDIPINIIDE